jgi:hypothetical protein
MLDTRPIHREYTSGSDRIRLFRVGSDRYQKVSYPIRCGIYSEVETEEAILHFNLNHEIIRLIGQGKGWPHPQEWLKRTVGNDWIYYSTGGYTGVFETTGEYYLPNLPYLTNKYMGGNPFANPFVDSLIRKWHPILENVRGRIDSFPAEIQDFVDAALTNCPTTLSTKADEFAAICKGRVSVLPPDTRHVDYNVIPVTVTRGCLHKCRFCRVKNETPFSSGTRSEISAQIEQLRTLYDRDLANYNSIFLGDHDGLLADPEVLIFAIEEAQRKLHLGRSTINGTNYFLFGSASALLCTPQSLFSRLEKSPGKVYINIGLESADQETLDYLGKPLDSGKVVETFDLIQDINRAYANIEISANFVIGDNLSQNHYDSLLSLIRDRIPRTRSKGCVYLSPLEGGDVSRLRLFEFYRLKRLSRLPLFLYLIQRL